MVTDRSYTGRLMLMQTMLVAVAKCKFKLFSTKMYFQVDFSREIKLLNGIVHAMSLQPLHLGRKQITNLASAFVVTSTMIIQGFHGYS